MSLVVCVVAPTGRDAELVVDVLVHNGLSAEACKDMSMFQRLTFDEMGILLIAEEALNPTFSRSLSEQVRQQPAWSDLPILVLTDGRERKPPLRLHEEHAALGAPVLLERPIRTATLISSVRAALRARQRQFEIRDILRDRDKALSELKTERETLNAIMDNLPIGVMLARSDGQVVLGNRSMERILRHPVLPSSYRLPPDQWVAFHPDGRRLQPGESPLSRAVALHQPTPPEDYLYQRGDGSLAWISVTAAPILTDQKTVTGAVIAVSDIDNQKRTDSNLHRSNERFRRLIEHSTVGLMIGDFNGGISYANPAILERLGYTAEEVASGVLHWIDSSLQTERKALQELRSTGTAESYQKTFTAKDGRSVPFLIGATMIPSQRINGSSSEVAIFATDLSGQKQAEAALIQSEKLAAVGRLAASISHEINNPLEALTNLIYLARRIENGSPEVASLLAVADQELQRVSQITAQTLRFHRQSTNPTRITPEDLLQPTLTLYNRRLLNSHIHLELHHSGAGFLTCYEGDVRQVLNNLISNAIDSMRTGGRLVIRTSKGRMREEDTPAIRITIADTGHGMPPAVKQRIYEPFYTTKGLNGTGLGLWISRGIVEKHRGRLQVHSRTGETPSRPSGSVFSMLLPANAF